MKNDKSNTEESSGGRNRDALPSLGAASGSVERWVIVRNHAEFLYMTEWIWMSGFKPPLLARPREYPVVLIVGGPGLPGWSDSLDRAANYVSFEDFISQNDKDR